MLLVVRRQTKRFKSREYSNLEHWRFAKRFFYELKRWVFLVARLSKCCFSFSAVSFTLTTDWWSDLIIQKCGKKNCVAKPMAMLRCNNFLNIHVELVVSVVSFGWLSDFAPTVALIFLLWLCVRLRGRMVSSVHLVLVVVMMKGTGVAFHQVAWNIFWRCMTERRVL